MTHRVAPEYKRINLAIAKGKSGAVQGRGPLWLRMCHALSAASCTLPEKPSVLVAAAWRTGKDKVRGKRKDGALLHLLSL